ncbi:MAG: rubrerythrin family protein [Caldisericia bacterium]|nr:rubrerythrin family protein [Caldisericia bacterium]
MEKTQENLKAAFAGESQANRKYLAYAAKAELEGFHFIAKLFKAAAAAETIHALAHFKNAGLIKSTEENLKDAIAGETFEFDSMYPKMIKEAKEEEQNAALRGFTLALGAEKSHADMYSEALENINTKEDEPVYLCKVCGYVHAGKKPEICPVCGAKALAFSEIS